MFSLMLQTCTLLLHILAVLLFWFNFNKGTGVSYLGIRWKKQEAEWHWIMWTAITGTPYQKLLQWWNQGKWDGRYIEHAWETGQGKQIWSKNLKDTDQFEDLCKSVTFKLILNIEWDSADWVIWSKQGSKLGSVNMVIKLQGLYYWC